MTGARFVVGRTTDHGRGSWVVVDVENDAVVSHHRNLERAEARAFWLNEPEVTA